MKNSSLNFQEEELREPGEVELCLDDEMGEEACLFAGRGTGMPGYIRDLYQSADCKIVIMGGPGRKRPFFTHVSRAADPYPLAYRRDGRTHAQKILEKSFAEGLIDFAEFSHGQEVLSKIKDEEMPQHIKEMNLSVRGLIERVLMNPNIDVVQMANAVSLAKELGHHDLVKELKLDHIELTSMKGTSDNWGSRRWELLLHTTEMIRCPKCDQKYSVMEHVVQCPNCEDRIYKITGEYYENGLDTLTKAELKVVAQDFGVEVYELYPYKTPDTTTVGTTWNPAPINSSHRGTNHPILKKIDKFAAQKKGVRPGSLFRWVDEAFKKDKEGNLVNSFDGPVIARIWEYWKVTNAVLGIKWVKMIQCTSCGHDHPFETWNAEEPFCEECQTDLSDRFPVQVMQRSNVYKVLPPSERTDDNYTALNNELGDKWLQLSDEIGNDSDLIAAIQAKREIQERKRAAKLARNTQVNHG